MVSQSRRPGESSFVQSSSAPGPLGTTSASPPALLQSSARHCKRSYCRAAKATFAPWFANCRAMALPIPAEAPVMITT